MAGITNVVSSLDIIQRKYTFDVQPTPDVLTLAYNAVDDKAISIYVDCSADWEIECPNWLVPSQKSGANYATVTFTAQNNLDYVARSGKLIIKSEYMGVKRSFSFDVTQSAFEFDNTAVEFKNLEAVDAGTYTVDVVCSGAWELRDYESWIGASATSGNGNAKITIRPQDNVEMSSRQITFYVYSTLKGVRKNITVSQKAFVFDTRDVSVPTFASIEPKTAQVALGECLSTWTVRDIPSWVTVSPISGSGSATLTIIPTENLNTSTRSAIIKVVSDKNASLFKEISISQEAFVFDTEAVTVPEFEVLAPKSVEIVVGECTGSWSVANAPNWLTVEPMSGTGAGKVTVAASENLTSANRNATFHIVSDKNPSLVKEISVSQGGYVLKAGTLNIDVPASATGGITAGAAEYSVDVDCSGQWKAGCRENNWCQLLDWSGTGSGKIIFSVSNNKDSTTREATIEISSLDGYAGTVAVKVTQAAATGK